MAPYGIDTEDFVLKSMEENSIKEQYNSTFKQLSFQDVQRTNFMNMRATS